MLSTPMRSLPHQKLPLYFLVDDQIEYVTDNERDAEALACSTDGRVVVETRARAALASNVSDVSNVQTSQTPKCFDVQTSETFQNLRDKSEARESAGIFSSPLLKNSATHLARDVGEGYCLHVEMSTIF